MDISELNNILKLAGLEARQIDAEAPEADAEMVCKDCGDTQGHPTTDCEHDCNDPEGEHWVCKDEEEAIAIVQKLSKTVLVTFPDNVRMSRINEHLWDYFSKLAEEIQQPIAA